MYAMSIYYTIQIAPKLSLFFSFLLHLWIIPFYILVDEKNSTCSISMARFPSCLLCKEEKKEKKVEKFCFFLAQSMRTFMCYYLSVAMDTMAAFIIQFSFEWRDGWCFW